MFHVDFPDDDPGTAVTWTLTPDGGITRDAVDYHPTFYVSAPGGTLQDAATLLEGHPRVESSISYQEEDVGLHGQTFSINSPVLSSTPVDQPSAADSE